MLTVVIDEQERAGLGVDLDQLARGRQADHTFYLGSWRTSRQEIAKELLLDAEGANAHPNAPKSRPGHQPNPTVGPALLRIPKRLLHVRSVRHTAPDRHQRSPQISWRTRRPL